MNSIKDYLNGNFSEKELELISDQLINAKFDQEKRKEWVNKLRQEHGVHKNPGLAAGIIRYKRHFVFAIAATLLLLISVFIIFSKTGTPKYLQAVNEQISQLKIMGDQSILRKGPQELEKIRTAATLSYVNKNYEESIKYWKELTERNVAGGMDFFYLGLCQLQQRHSEPKDALQSFQKSRELDGPEAELAWVIALCHLKSGTIDQGKVQLEQIINSKGYKQESAKKLLRLLE